MAEDGRTVSKLLDMVIRTACFCSGVSGQDFFEKGPVSGESSLTDNRGSLRGRLLARVEEHAVISTP